MLKSSNSCRHFFIWQGDRHMVIGDDSDADGDADHLMVIEDANT